MRKITIMGLWAQWIENQFSITQQLDLGKADFYEQRYCCGLKPILKSMLFREFLWQSRRVTYSVGHLAKGQSSSLYVFTEMTSSVFLIYLLEVHVLSK